MLKSKIFKDVKDNPFKLFRTLIGMQGPKYLAKRALELTLGYPLFVISYLMPRNKNKWVFGTNVGFTDNSKYLYLYSNERKDEVIPIWISKNSTDIQWIRHCGGKAYKKYSLKGIFHCLTAGRYIYTYHSSDINYFTSGNVKKINLWHGVGIKGSSKGKNGKEATISRKSGILTRILMPYYWEKDTIFLSTSSLMDKHFQEMFNLSPKAIRDAIYPRCYYMCRPIKEVKDYIKKYETKEMNELVKSLFKYNKIFLYMPTWRGNLNDDFISKANFNFDELNQVMKETNRLFIFKLHPAVKILNNFQHENYSNILFLDKSLDIYPIIPFTTTLITDYSSIFYDYILLDKEVILYPFDKAEYIDQSNDLAFDYDEYTPGYRVYDNKQFMAAISSDEKFSIPNKEWIINKFWGKADKDDLETFYNAIKSL